MRGRNRPQLLRAVGVPEAAGPVLTLVAMALLAGRRDIAEIARFATTLTQPQRRRLGLPRKKGTRAFYEVPGYGVLDQVLTRVHPEAFASRLNAWLAHCAGTPPHLRVMNIELLPKRTDGINAFRADFAVNKLRRDEWHGASTGSRESGPSEVIHR